MVKPVIGIIGRSRVSDTGFNLIATPESERLAIIRYGGNPILILPPQMIEYQRCLTENPTPGKLPRLTDTEKEMVYRQIDLCKGVLLPGGDMMFEYDRIVCEYCLKEDIPILGICMGMQIMCTYDRNVILKKINTNIKHKVLDDNYFHYVSIMKHSKLFKIIKNNEIKVNSRHALRVDSTGLSTISGKSSDDVIEAVEFPNKKYAIGIQWHPELNFDSDVNSANIFKSFIETCNKN